MRQVKKQGHVRWGIKLVWGRASKTK